MLGLMQDRPLLISQMIDFAATYYPKVEIVTRTVEGPIHRHGYRDAAKRMPIALVAGRLGCAADPQDR